MLTTKGLALIKRWEGCKLTSYQCPAGKWTIGYGTTTAAGVGTIGPGMTITQAQADEWLARSLVKYENTVTKSLKRTASPQQHDAMVSLCYNIGQGAFPSSSVVRLFNAGDNVGAAEAFLLWTKARDPKTKKLITVKGLVNRRLDEKKHFLSEGPVVVLAPVTPPVTPVVNETKVDKLPTPAAPTLWDSISTFLRKVFQ